MPWVFVMMRLATPVTGDSRSTTGDDVNPPLTSAFCLAHKVLALAQRALGVGWHAAEKCAAYAFAGIHETTVRADRAAPETAIDSAAPERRGGRPTRARTGAAARGKEDKDHRER